MPRKKTPIKEPFRKRPAVKDPPEPEEPPVKEPPEDLPGEPASPPIGDPPRKRRPVRTTDRKPALSRT